MKMTWTQKAHRIDARYHGRQAAAAIRHALVAQQEANLWQPVSSERTSYWLAEATRQQQAATEQARRAMHSAILSDLETCGRDQMTPEQIARERKAEDRLRRADAAMQRHNMQAADTARKAQ